MNKLNKPIQKLLNLTKIKRNIKLYAVYYYNPRTRRYDLRSEDDMSRLVAEVEVLREALKDVIPFMECGQDPADDAKLVAARARAVALLPKVKP